MTSPRIVGFDIEATDLDADWGITLAFGWKPLGEKAKVISLEQFYPPCDDCKKVSTETDKELLKAAHEIISGADLIFGWYSKGFDIKFLNARMLTAGLPPLPNVPHIDLYFTAKSNFKLKSNRLVAWEEFLGTKSSKTPLKRKVWQMARAGRPKALKYVADHCLADVEVLEEAYMKLRPFVRLHPKVAGDDLGKCRVCGSDRLQKRGTRLTALKREKQAVQCQNCGRYDMRDIVW